MATFTELKIGPIGVIPSAEGSQLNIRVIKEKLKEIRDATESFYAQAVAYEAYVSEREAEILALIADHEARITANEGDISTNQTNIANNAADMFRHDGTQPMTGNIELDGSWVSNDGGNEGLSVTAAGYVGVGINPALYALHVYGSTATLAVQKDGGATGKIAAASNALQIGSISNHRVDFVINNSTRVLTIDTASMVGINDTTPEYTLDVSGDGRFTGDLIVGSVATPTYSLEVGGSGRLTGTLYIGTIASTGSVVTFNDSIAVTGEVEATSADINGNADVSGTLDVHDTLTTNNSDVRIGTGAIGNSGDVLTFAAGAGGKATFAGPVDAGAIVSTGDIQCGGTFKSSDGSSGVATGVFLTNDGQTATVKDGLIVNLV